MPCVHAAGQKTHRDALAVEVIPAPAEPTLLPPPVEEVVVCQLEYCVHGGQRVGVGVGVGLERVCGCVVGTLGFPLQVFVRNRAMSVVCCCWERRGGRRRGKRERKTRDRVLLRFGRVEREGKGSKWKGRGGRIASCGCGCVCVAGLEQDCGYPVSRMNRFERSQSAREASNPPKQPQGEALRVHRGRRGG